MFIATPSPGSWTNLHDCRWTASSLLSNVVPLSGRYKNLRQLFVDTLNVLDADAADVVAQLCELAGEFQYLDTINGLLRELSSNVSITSRECDALTHLKRSNVAVFPVHSESGTIDLRSAADPH